MRFIIIIFIIFVCQNLYAGRILFDKSSNKYLVGWYQSGATKGLLLKNAVNCKVDITNLEEREITDKEWSEIWNKYILIPLNQEKALKDAKKDTKKEELKKKFGWTDEDIENLKEILK